MPVYVLECLLADGKTAAIQRGLRHFPLAALRLNYVTLRYSGRGPMSAVGPILLHNSLLTAAKPAPELFPLAGLRHRCVGTDAVARPTPGKQLPSAPRFKMNAFWASENFDAFIALRSSPARESTRKTLPKNDPVLRPQSICLSIAALSSPSLAHCPFVLS